MLDLTQNNIPETADQWNNRVANQCSILSAQYYPDGCKSHVAILTTYWTGDYGQLVRHISGQPGVIHELVSSLAQPSVVTMSSIMEPDLREGSDSDSSTTSTEQMDADIKDHYVLLPHEGQLKGRNLSSVNHHSAQYSVTVQWQETQYLG